MPISQRDLAKALNLSQAAVSRALRNDHRVAKATRDRVWAMARKMGYKPDVFSAALASKAHSSAAEFKGCPLISLHQPSFNLQPLLREDFNRRAEELCTERGFILRRHLIAPRERPQDLARRFYDQGVQGIIMGPARGDISWFEQFPTEHFCVVNIAGRLTHLPYPSIRLDVFGMMEQFYSMARKRGYERIGAALFKHDPHHPDDAALRGAFLNSQRQTLGQADSSLLFDVPQRTLEPRESVRQRFHKWVREVQPDALFLFSTEQYHWLDELPNRGEVKGCVVQVSSPKETNYDQVAHVSSPWHRVAEIAVQWLENAIRLRHYGPQELPPHGVVESTIIAGPSFPAVK